LVTYLLLLPCHLLLASCYFLESRWIPASAGMTNLMNQNMIKNWMPREKWDALVLGEGCPLCSLVKAPGADNDNNHFIADLAMNRLMLVKNQYVKGYCLLVCLKHVREPYELPQDEQEQYFDDMMVAGMALEKVFGADKMNFQILGNAVPHLHTHIVPRYYGDAAPNHPIDTNASQVILKPQEYRVRVETIREMLTRIRAHRQRG
jgi:diadenosine tetraphosphate (Ap4A) HIT family hydrolase